MAKLYVANATKQRFEFVYRLPGSPGAKLQTIEIGGQIQVGGPTSIFLPEDIDSVLEQYRQYGLVSVDEMDRGRTAFTGLCYSVDKPVSIDRLQRAMQRNSEALDKRGRVIRQEAAISVNNAIENELLEKRTETGLRGLEMSVQEEDNRAGDRSGPRMSEGVRVTRSEPGSPPPVVPRRGRPRKAA